MSIPLNQLSYTALTLHVANRSAKSLCGIALLVVEKGAIAFQKDFLVKPPTKTFSFSDYHGITADRVKDAPTLEALWPQISSYIVDKNLVVYNACDTINRLSSSLDSYNISLPDLNCLDVRDLFNQNRERYSLKELSKSVGYDDNFENGNMMDNLLLYRAIIENAAERGSRILQKTFHVVSDKKSCPPSPPKEKSPQNLPSKEVSSVKVAAQSSGCLLPILQVIILVVLLFS